MAVNGILLGQSDKNDNKNDLNFKFYKTFSTSGNSWSYIDLPNSYIYKIFINKINNWGSRDGDYMNLNIKNDESYYYYYYSSSFLTNYNPEPWGVSQSEKHSGSYSTFNLIGESTYNNTQNEAPLYLTICALPSGGWCIAQYFNSLKKFVRWKVTSNLSLEYYNKYQQSGETIAQIYRAPFKF